MFSRGSNETFTNVNGRWYRQVSCFSAGDGYGTGSSEKNIGTATNRDACYDKVRTEEPYANGATYSTTESKSCYAEFGMTTRNTNKEWESCLFTDQGNCSTLGEVEKMDFGEN